MSKKHPHQSHAATAVMSSTPLSQAGEYRVIKHDLFRVVILNVLYLALVLVLYFTDQKAHYLENLFSRWLHF